MCAAPNFKQHIKLILDQQLNTSESPIFACMAKVAFLELNPKGKDTRLTHIRYATSFPPFFSLLQCEQQAGGCQAGPDNPIFNERRGVAW